MISTQRFFSATCRYMQTYVTYQLIIILIAHGGNINSRIYDRFYVTYVCIERPAPTLSLSNDQRHLRGVAQRPLLESVDPVRCGGWHLCGPPICWASRRTLWVNCTPRRKLDNPPAVAYRISLFLCRYTFKLRPVLLLQVDRVRGRW